MAAPSPGSRPATPLAVVVALGATALIVVAMLPPRTVPTVGRAAAESSSSDPSPRLASDRLDSYLLDDGADGGLIGPTRAAELAILASIPVTSNDGSSPSVGGQSRHRAVK